MGVPGRYIMLILKGLCYDHKRNFPLAVFLFLAALRAYGGLGHSLPNICICLCAYKISLRDIHKK